ncbi:hypothetical protein AAFF_G00407760 [Aldrovandia affinis]|uniref:Uncharacterized protein n=1 Tax=Aldrovandia affinis TaxID=143900 RepID=A0AAD7WJU0_9TELE|nr:hypothetical protein AAFF_G00407760 [Aldrovandia affinis]
MRRGVGELWMSFPCPGSSVVGDSVRSTWSQTLALATPPAGCRRDVLIGSGQGGNLFSGDVRGGVGELGSWGRVEPDTLGCAARSRTDDGHPSSSSTQRAVSESQPPALRFGVSGTQPEVWAADGLLNRYVFGTEGEDPVWPSLSAQGAVSLRLPCTVLGSTS